MKTASAKKHALWFSTADLEQPVGAAEPVLLHEFFERQVMLRPAHPAIECRGETLTYAQLDAAADRIAALLRHRGIGPGSLVGIYMLKSCRLYAALLGVLKAGAGYVPIDPKFPIERTRAILTDAGAAVVLSEGARRDAIASRVEAEVIDLNDMLNVDFSLPFAPALVGSTDICYVIYTSGSTGAPKGVIIEHRNAVNFVRALHKVYGLGGRDRIYQGFSVAFDASVEEIWAAFSLGGTLVVPSEEISRSTVDAAEFITSHRITCFSTVPSFLALMEAALPTLSLLILGGEVCPAELIERWTRAGLRILNTYGPTEATVVTTVAECRPGVPVTIGTAMPGYKTLVLDENGSPVGPSECGELYIGGDSVARGYMKRPELTSARFVANPIAEDGDQLGRLYRTYDLVRLTETGDLQFVGRADGQVKIRGFRVELSEIEAVLMEHPSIRLAAATVVDAGGLPEIAAYAVLPDSASELDRESVAELLRSRLPDYMVPKYLDTLDKLPIQTSGKTDRKELPPPINLLNVSKQDVVRPTTALEHVIADAWERVLLITPISVNQDFFLDVHGHSLAAAKIVTDLRAKLNTVQISVRDFYEHRTVRELASHLESLGVKAPGDKGDGAPSAEAATDALAPPPLPWFRWICAVLQLATLIVHYAVTTGPLVFTVIIAVMTLDGTLDWTTTAKVTTIVGFAIWPSWLLLGIAVKWLVIGRYRPGRYPVWGFYYFRWWLVTRFQALTWSQMFNGTPLMSVYYRLMGAKIGKNCIIGTPLCSAFDLVTIGDNSSIGDDTHVLGYRVESGWLILGNVSIGRDCFVGTHCCLGLNVAMRDGSRLDDMSLLADGTVIRQGEARRGSPAVPAEVTPPRSTRKAPRRGAGFAFGVIHLALIYAMGYFLLLSLAPGVGLVLYTLYAAGAARAIAVAFAAVPISILWYLQLVILVKSFAIGKIPVGTYSVHSVTYLRYWFMKYLLDNTREIIQPLYATLFLPRFMRQLGAKVGRMVEISTVMHAMPDLLEVGDGGFLADACIVGGQRIHDGVIEIRANKIGKRTFVGNSAFVPAGVDLGEDGLVGVLSTPPSGADRTPDGSRWLGSPGFELPNTQPATCFSIRRTFEPSRLLVAVRTIVEMLRILLPGTIAIADIVVFCAMVVALYRSHPLYQVLLVAPMLALFLSFVSLIGVAILKNILMGTFVPTLRPLWCVYVWFNEVVNAVYETIAATALAPLMGTPFASAFLRVLGCRIGRWVFLESTLFSEFDLVEIGDRASINLGCTIQPHLFEDRIMKADTVAIGDGCSVGNMAIVLYSTEMQAGSSLGPLSVLMKGEGLPAASRWYGIPSQPAAAA